MSAEQSPPENSRPPDDRATSLEQLIRERDRLHAALPAHSIPPAMLARLDDLDDAIDALRAEIAAGEDTR